MNELHSTAPVIFLGFDSETAFFSNVILPHKISVGLRGQGIELAPPLPQSFMPGTKIYVWGRCLVETPISGAFPLQHRAT